jgi:hypothetical protein
MYPGFLERSAGKVRHGVIDAGDGDGRQVGGAVDNHSACKGTGELLANERFGGAHFGGPGYR